MFLEKGEKIMETIDTFKNRFILGDCIDIMRKMPENSIDLIVTDPPYNINWKYSDKVDDNRKDYDAWCLRWSELCFRLLKDNGIFCIINYPEKNNVLFTRLTEKGYNFIQQLIWSYPTNIGHSKYRYTRTYRTILIFSKDKKKRYTFNPIKQPYKNPTDKRIKKLIEDGSNGTTHYDIFNINLCKNVSRSKKKNGINQLPDRLAEILIKTYSNKEYIVLDPFVGNGTIFDMAKKLGRYAIGIDINKY